MSESYEVQLMDSEDVIVVPDVSGSKPDRFHQPNAAFMCKACLRERNASHTSPDPRYCDECYLFLTGEAVRGAFGRWVPTRSDGRVPDSSILPGDRVQLCFQPDGLEAWFTVESVEGELLNFTDIPSACLNTIRKASVYEVFEHQIKEGEVTTRETLTPEENLKRCREKLVEADNSGADPRVIGLWRSKVEQAEKLANGKPVASTKTRETKPEPEGHPCNCGCGGTAKARSNFLPGHDARFAGYIRKYDQELVKVEELPGLVQAMIIANHELVKRAREHNKATAKK